MHCAQPGAQNHNTTGRPDAARSTVGSINNSLDAEVTGADWGAAPESATSLAHPDANNTTASDSPHNKDRVPLMTSR